MTTLFNGHVPQPPKPVVFCGIPREQAPDAEEIAATHRLTDELQQLVALCRVPNTPFTGRFRFTGWH